MSTYQDEGVVELIEKASRIEYPASTVETTNIWDAGSQCYIRASVQHLQFFQLHSLTDDTLEEILS